MKDTYCRQVMKGTPEANTQRVKFRYTIPASNVSGLPQAPDTSC